MVNSPADAILKRIVEGDREALGELYDRYSGVVNGIARRILRDSGDAEDVVQTVFLQVWRQARRYDANRGPVAAWLCTLARTRALDALRTRASRRESVHDMSREPTGTTLATEHLAIHQALHALPDRHRLALELAYFEGLTQVEIAERLGEPLGTVKTRARAALKGLRVMLAGVGAPELAGRMSGGPDVQHARPVDGAPRG